MRNLFIFVCAVLACNCSSKNSDGFAIRTDDVDVASFSSGLFEHLADRERELTCNDSLQREIITVYDNEGEDLKDRTFARLPAKNKILWTFSGAEVDFSNGEVRFNDLSSAHPEQVLAHELGHRILLLLVNQLDSGPPRQRSSVWNNCP